MNDLQIRFASGRDVLNAYWGYLSDGGLVLPDHGLDVGQPVALEVSIDSLQSRYALAGAVVRRDGGQMIVRFNPGEPHDVLLTDALSETDNVPARRHRRHRVDREGRLVAGAGEASCHVVDVSDEGCCIQLGAGELAALPIGTYVVVRWDDVAVTGKVVWARHNERGVACDAGACEGLRTYVARLAGGGHRTSPAELR